MIECGRGEYRRVGSRRIYGHHEFTVGSGGEYAKVILDVSFGGRTGARNESERNA
jgi:hypothetical protein